MRETFTKGCTEYTKTDGSQREILMNPVVREALLRQQAISRNQGEYVFCTRGGIPLAGQVGAEVTVTIEIEAKLPNGATDQLVRTVTENSHTLKFDSHGFESE